MPLDQSEYTDFVTEAVQPLLVAGGAGLGRRERDELGLVLGGQHCGVRALVRPRRQCGPGRGPVSGVADPGISSTSYGAAIAKRLLGAGKDTRSGQGLEHLLLARFGTRGDRPARHRRRPALAALRSAQPRATPSTSRHDEPAPEGGGRPPAGALLRRAPQRRAFVTTSRRRPRPDADRDVGGRPVPQGRNPHR